jgi:hypothetical protein
MTPRMKELLEQQDAIQVQGIGYFLIRTPTNQLACRTSRTRCFRDAESRSSAEFAYTYRKAGLLGLGDKSVWDPDNIEEWNAAIDELVPLRWLLMTPTAHYQFRHGIPFCPGDSIQSRTSKSSWE